MKTAILLATILCFTSGSVLQGKYTTQDGNDLNYFIENTEKRASVLLGHLVNVTYDKEEELVRFNMFGLDPFTEEDVEREAQVTRDLMDTELGKSLPGLSKYVFDQHGQFGYENEGLMLLHQLALFSHQHHDGAHTEHNGRQKRNVLGQFFGGSDGKLESNRVEGVFSGEVVSICNGRYLAPHGGCTIDLGVQGSDNKCEDKPGREPARQFSAKDISRGCYGLCGPWCSCWPHVCGDCCWHPGCNEHDKYCEDPDSHACKWGKGVVYGRKGLPTC